MKRRITLSIALALSIVLALLTNSDRSAQAQRRQVLAADTGVVTLGANQTLRLTVAGPVGVVNPDHHILEFRRTNYTENACSGSVCKLAVASVQNSGAVTLLPGEAVSFTVGPDIQGNGVRVAVLSSSQDVRANAMIINNLTGEVQAVQMSIQRENQ